jgi:hypothetical protein
MHKCVGGLHSFFPCFQGKAILPSHLCLSENMVRMGKGRKISTRKFYEEGSEENEPNEMCAIEDDDYNWL